METKNITSIDSPVLNLTYSILKTKDEFYLKQYCCLTKAPITKKIQNSEIISGYGKKLYDDNFILYLNTLLDGLKGQQNIIFAPTSNKAREIACSLKQNYHCEEKRITELIEYYKNTVHPDYSMCTTLSNGTVYHHGKLPGHVRCTIEHAIHNKWVNNVSCTTTLLQGVNLPAQNIIIRNPHLYIKKYRNKSELTNYEMANLRGRAGRLLKDFIGRTLVLDETAFANTDGYDQVELFDDVTKELPGGYGERYEKYKEEIEQAIMTDKPADSSMEGFGDLVSYIRQSVLR